MGTGINEQISTELDRIERDERVSIVYACESGSRASVFESRDSDYDVRFLWTECSGHRSSASTARAFSRRRVDSCLKPRGDQK